MSDMKAWGGNCVDHKDGADICLMGVPFDSAASINKGAAMAPDNLRALSKFLPCVSEEGVDFEGFKIYDAGDVEPDLNWERFFGVVEDSAYDLFKTGSFCFFLGGDHSVTIPLQKAFKKQYPNEKIGVIHFDSHADICAEYEGHKWSHACTARRAVEDVLGSPRDWAMVGIRSYEPQEIDYLKNHPVKLIKAYDLHKKGYEAACAELKEHFSGYDKIYLTLDIDVIDPSGAPGTGTPEAGGPTSREIIEMVKFLTANLPVAAMDIVEVSPPLDTRNQITSWAALKIMYEVFAIVKGRR
ncbi:MAG: agmatinase [Oscillospiraceae bacterium]|nr:agmatinase [Oscillospiraceae bacterium]